MPLFEYLERAFQGRWEWLTDLKVLWRWDSLRSDARFEAFIERVKFPD